MTQKYQNDLSLPRQIVYENIPVVTNELLADSLGLSSRAISTNFSTNKRRYQPGVHYFLIKGKALKQLLDNPQYSCLSDYEGISLFLWTERGCYMLIDSLATLDNYDALKSAVFDYFNQRKVTHNFLDEKEYKKPSYRFDLNKLYQDEKEILIDNEVHEVGGWFNFNNAMLAYRTIKRIKIKCALEDIDMAEDLNMIEAINPGRADTIDVLRKLLFIYTYVTDIGERDRMSFYEVSNN